MTASIVERLRDKSLVIQHPERDKVADLIEQQAKEIAELKALAKKMADALDSAIAGMGGSYAIWSPNANEALSAYRELIKE